MPTSQEHERSIINALAITDPSMDTGLGTPIRKVISAVANEMAAYDVDTNTTTSLYSIESVSGTELDYLVGLFGFTRQAAKRATGTVRIKRDNGDSVLQIAYGTQFMKPATAMSPAITFQTTAYQELAEGVLSAEIAVVATVNGLVGNVPANTITYANSFGGYFKVTNENPTVGGRDAESDENLRARFLATVFRNMAGTKDQYAGLAYAHEDVNRVNIIGRESRYSEVVMVGSGYTAHATASKIDMDVEFFIDLSKRLWVKDTDSDTVIDGGYISVDQTQSPFVITFLGKEVSETVLFATNVAVQLSYLPIVEVDSVVVGGSTLVEDTDYTVDYDAGTITFSISSSPVNIASIVYKQSPVSVGQYVTIEFDYISKHNRGGNNDVDIFVDCRYPQLASDIQFLDITNTVTSATAANWLLGDNTLPIEGSVFIALSHQPVLSSTGAVNVGVSQTLYEGTHYALMYDNTKKAGSNIAADAILFTGWTVGDGVMTYGSGATEISIPDGTAFSIPYYYNSDVDSVQTLISEQSVMTMDTVVHEAKRRYFDVNLAVMYSAKNRSDVNNSIESAVRAWATGLPFGAIVQFSDIETVVANVAGVDNVRVAKSTDGTDYGIVEYARDGVTLVSQVPYTDDFGLAQDEVFELNSLNIINKSQQNW